MTKDGDAQGHYICDIRRKDSDCDTWFRTKDNKIPVELLLKDVTKKAVVVLYKRIG
jgi:hypothetical protein